MSQTSPTPQKKVNWDDLSDEEKKQVKDQMALALGKDSELELPWEEQQKYEMLYKKALMVLRSQGRTLATGLLGINRVVWTRSEAIGTACITVSDRRPKIYVNVDFLEQLQKLSIEKKKKPYPANILLAGVLAHELCHFMFRHGSKIQNERVKNKDLRNIVFDIFINHFLKKLNLHYFSELLYPDRDTPDLMFFLNASAESVKHQQFYNQCQQIQASLTDIENYLIKNLPPDMLKQLCETVVLIGSHGDGSEQEESDNKLDFDNQEELDDVIREFFSKQGRQDQKNFNKSASRFGDYFEDDLKVERKKDQAFEDFSKRAMVRNTRGQILQSVGRYNGPTTTATWRPMNNRHKLMQAAAGVMPIWWKKPIKVDFGKLRMYIDMSGSMTGLKDLIVSIILGLEKSWEVELFLFTTEVTPTTKKDLQDGKFRTGGTEFDCVFNHLRACEDGQAMPRKVIMITDGYNYGLSKENVELLDSSFFDLFVVYTKDHSADCLEKYTKDKWLLDF